MNTAPLIHETECPFKASNGETYTAQGAFVDDSRAMVYIDQVKHTPLKFWVTDWNGNVIGGGDVTGAWQQQNIRTTYSMVAVHFKIFETGVWYQGRYSPDYGNFCKARRAQRQRSLGGGYFR